jgi:hypothetical protein
MTKEKFITIDFKKLSETLLIVFGSVLILFSAIYLFKILKKPTIPIRENVVKNLSEFEDEEFEEEMRDEERERI